MPPSSFDWVEARRMCTPKLQFDLLAKEVKSNVECINKSDSQIGECTFNNQKRNEIIVARCIENIPDSSIVFRLSKRVKPILS